MTPVNLLNSYLNNIIGPVMNHLYQWFVAIFDVCGINIVSFLLCCFGIMCVQRLLSNGASAPPLDRQNFKSYGWSSNVPEVKVQERGLVVRK